ncbi:hypothetical protein ISS37_07945 [candidate division KSB1 bacterium]|nr:hypothetical protein [candidate division KSB1 bacterium]
MLIVLVIRYLLVNVGRGLASDLVLVNGVIGTVYHQQSMADALSIQGDR